MLSIDLMLWYFGYPKKINEVILKKIYSDEVEDYCHVSFQYKNMTLCLVSNGNLEWYLIIFLIWKRYF
jgi:predicted dehydrogenase